MNRSPSNQHRMVTQFFLQQINAHRCTRFNLSRGSASAMRRLRQEAGDLEEAPLPEQVVGDEEVAEQPEHEVDGDVGASPRTLRKNLTGMPCIGNGASSSTQLHPTPAAHPSGAAMPSLAKALLANGIIVRWTTSWDPRELRLKTKRRIVETEAF